MIKKRSFPVVAIGASAGGLEAITQLLQHLPPETGMAFIYIQHLSPDHQSILTALLSKETQMKVQEVRNNMLIEVDNFYIIPPGKEMTLIDGHIKLTPRSKSPGIPLPIDAFFQSLATIHKKDAIAVILSGSGRDGSIGMAAIKKEAGLTFAQDASAKFASMPQSAIAEGVVDFVLSPKEIALELGRIGKQGFTKTIITGKSSPNLASVLSLVHKETGVDFTVYKMPTINRRIERRMLLNNVTTVKAYADILAGNPNEINVLYQDLLINVTDFFRDTETHLYLKKELLPKLLSSKNAGETLRIWIPACSTGEEAYSIAMNILEIQGNMDTDLPVQIFATDLSAGAIVKARQGEYDAKAVASVSPKRIQRFYTKSGNRFRIAKAVRDMCVFAPHNILTDPPFSHVDFISCCNMLIYLDTTAQKKVMSTFHYALNSGGYLMLGKSETIGTASQLFSQVNKKYKVYSRKNTATRQALPQLLPRSKSRTVPVKGTRAPVTAGTPSPNPAFSGTVDALLLARYIPASVVINQHLEILQFRGATDLYLKHPAGKASLNLLKMCPPEMAFELRIAVSKVIKQEKGFPKTSIEIKTGTALRLVTIDVVPLMSEGEELLMLVVFGEAGRLADPTVPGGKGKNNPFKERLIKKMQGDLAAARENMQVFAQEQEAFSEELQRANEEVVSSNEELQSLNDELETSKEEIESSNEELITTNQELHTRNELLNESYDYSEAIINTMHEPMLVLDKDLRIKSSNGSFYKNFLVKEEETIGCLLFDLGNRQWAIPRLRKLLENMVFKNTDVHDFEVSNSFPGLGERTILLNARRIIQKNHGGQLILLAFNDITQRAQIQQKEKEGFIYAAIKDKVQNKRLEKSVIERTGELAHANKILEQNIHDLEIMNDELQAFAFVSSHDLQEPLRKIQTFTAKILENDYQNLSAEGKSYFERIQVSAKRMRTLIQDLIAYSKINASERSFVKTDPTVIISEVIKELEDTIQEKKALVEVNVKCSLPIILFQFRQLILNLVSNALKFSTPGKPPHIQIKSRLVKTSKLNMNREDKSLHSYCLISIADNGIGFDKKYNDRIFAVFQKLHSRDEFEGTGIGLAIVKKIVENHHGIIRVHSLPGKGTRFDIYMPV